MTVPGHQRLTRPLPAHAAVRQRLHQPDQLTLTDLPGAAALLLPPRSHDLTLPPTRRVGDTAREPRTINSAPLTKPRALDQPGDLAGGARKVIPAIRAAVCVVGHG